MSAPPTKRKVMGRVELGQGRPVAKAATPSPRLGQTRPATTSTRVPSSSRPVVGVARARVDMSSVAVPSSAASSPGIARVPTIASASATTSPSLGRGALHATPAPSQNGFSVPTSTYTFSSPVVRSPLTESTPTFASPSLAAQAQSPPLAPGIGHGDPVAPAKVRASVNGFSRLPEGSREGSTAKVRVASGSSSAGYFNLESADPRPAVRKQSSFGSSSANTRNRHSLVLADSPQASPGSSVPHVPTSPFIAARRPTNEHRPTHTSRPSIGGSSAISNTSAGAVSPGFASSAAMQSILRRPSLTPLSSSTHMQSFGGSLSPPRKPASGHADTSTSSSPDRTQLWDAVPMPGTPRDGTFLTSSTSAGSGVLLSPTRELGQEEMDAKVNRKILDLEISNKSLLAINSGLEVTKLKQAREIRELKRRLREGDHLASVDAGGEHPVHDAGEYDSDDDDSDDLAGALDADAPLQAELEASHARCKSMIDDMVQKARAAILSRPELPHQPSGNRVLHPAELEGMMDSSKDGYFRKRQREPSNSARTSGSFAPSSDSEAEYGPSMSASVEGSSPVTPTSSGVGYEHGSLDYMTLVAGTNRLALSQDTPKAS